MDRHAPRPRRPCFLHRLQRGVRPHPAPPAADRRGRRAGHARQARQHPAEGRARSTAAAWTRHAWRPTARRRSRPSSPASRPSRTSRALQDEIAHLHRMGVGAAFSFGVGQDAKASTQEIADIGQGGLSLPDRDYYLNTDDRTKAIRDGLPRPRRQDARPAGRHARAGAGRGARRSWRWRRGWRRRRISRVELRDPQRQLPPHDPRAARRRDARRRLGALLPGASACQSPGLLNVGRAAFFTAVGPDADGGRRWTTWKTYLRWHLIHSTRPVPEPRRSWTRIFHFYGTVLSGVPQQQPRWKRVLGATDGALGEAAGAALRRSRRSRRRPRPAPWPWCRT